MKGLAIIKVCIKPGKYFEYDRKFVITGNLVSSQELEELMARFGKDKIIKCFELAKKFYNAELDEKILNDEDNTIKELFNSTNVKKAPITPGTQGEGETPGENGSR